jgi:hypothetical protein
VIVEEGVDVDLPILFKHSSWAIKINRYKDR